MRAKLSDAARLASLHAACFDKGWPEADFVNHVENDYVWIDDAGQSLLVIREGGGQAEILTLGTHPDARGQGLAGHMIQEAMPELESPVLFLEVAEDNASAIALYNRLGFTPFGRRPNYYRRNDGRVAAIMMEKRLTPPDRA
jgi:ribosomal-protein-alanine N-acetyltransferase